jgi:hypothetical protein
MKTKGGQFPALFLCEAINKKPRQEAGFSVSHVRPQSDWAATSVAPNEANWAAALDHHRALDHNGARDDHDVATVQTAFAESVAMSARAAAAFSACAAETCDRACNQCSCEKNLHVVSLPKCGEFEDR